MTTSIEGRIAGNSFKEETTLTGSHEEHLSNATVTTLGEARNVAFKYTLNGKPLAYETGFRRLVEELWRQRITKDPTHAELIVRDDWDFGVIDYTRFVGNKVIDRSPRLLRKTRRVDFALGDDKVAVQRVRENRQNIL